MRLKSAILVAALQLACVGYTDEEKIRLHGFLTEPGTCTFRSQHDGYVGVMWLADDTKTTFQSPSLNGIIDWIQRQDCKIVP